MQLWWHRCVVKDSYHLHYCWRYVCNCDDTQRCVVKDSYHLHYCWRYVCNCDDTQRCVVKDSYHLHYCWRYLCNCDDTGVLLMTLTPCINAGAFITTVMTNSCVLLTTLTTCITVDAISATDHDDRQLCVVNHSDSLHYCWRYQCNWSWWQTAVCC